MLELGLPVVVRMVGGRTVELPFWVGLVSKLGSKGLDMGLEIGPVALVGVILAGLLFKSEVGTIPFWSKKLILVGEWVLAGF